MRAEEQRSADTHLIRLEPAGMPGAAIYLKDESIHPTGSLKHRLARSLFLYGLCNGWIGPSTRIIEASSGSTAISEAYFARLLRLEFLAIAPIGTSCRKLEEIKRYGGDYKLVPPHDIYTEAQAIADRCGGLYLDQFTYAERATDWRGANNIAESLFGQMAREPNPTPDWVICGAGTGGTSATIGRYIRYTPSLCEKTRLLVVDPEGSVFFDAYRGAPAKSDRPSRIEGIGRPRLEPSFLPSVIDAMAKVPDAASIAAAWWLKGMLGRSVGPSTGANFYGALHLARTKIQGEGALVTLICDHGERYEDTCFSRDWLKAQDLNLEPHLEDIDALWAGRAPRASLRMHEGGD